MRLYDITTGTGDFIANTNLPPTSSPRAPASPRTLTDHDTPAHWNGVHDFAHRFYSNMIRILAVALTHGPVASA